MGLQPRCKRSSRDREARAGVHDQSGTRSQSKPELGKSKSGVRGSAAQVRVAHNHRAATRQKLRLFPGRARAVYRIIRRNELIGTDDAQADGSGQSRHLPGNRAVGFQSGGS